VLEVTLLLFLWTMTHSNYLIELLTILTNHMKDLYGPICPTTTRTARSHIYGVFHMQITNPNC